MIHNFFFLLHFADILINYHKLYYYIIITNTSGNINELFKLISYIIVLV